MPLQLPEDRVAQLRDAQKSLADLRGDLASAQRAGIDVTDLQDRIDALEKMRAGLLAEFGPKSSRTRREYSREQ